MARYRGATLRKERAYGVQLETKSRQRPTDSKCKNNTPPGQHGSKRARNQGVYALQLVAKQAIRYRYGVLEKQFKKHFTEATRRQGLTGHNLLQILESRLDNVVYRMGFASTRAEARQLVSHKGIMIQSLDKTASTSDKPVYKEAHVVNIPSYEVQPGDRVLVREKAKKQDRIKRAMSLQLEHDAMVEWMDVDSKAFEGVFKYVPDRAELPTDINEQLVVELYSK